MEPAIAALFSGDPIPQDAACGWQERQDALNARPDKPMPPPWTWEIHDHSAATLCGGGEDAIIGNIMTVAPCEACADRADPKEWKWGRCGTPSLPDAKLIALAPELLEYVASSAMAGCATAKALIAKLEPLI